MMWRADTERVLHKIALAYLALAFDVGRPCFQAADMQLLKLQFGSIFDGDQLRECSFSIDRLITAI